MTLNRAEALAGVLISLILAVLPVIGDFDWTSTAGVIAGIIAVLGIVQTRLRGWQQQEARDDDRAAPLPPSDDTTGVKHTGL